MKQEEEVFLSLSQPIAFEYAVLDGKDISNTLQVAQLVKLSENAAEVFINSNSNKNILIPQPLTNMKMNLFISINDVEKSGDIYAKVIEKPAATKNSFYIRFTNKPPEVEAYLDLMYKSMKKA